MFAFSENQYAKKLVCEKLKITGKQYRKLIKKTRARKKAENEQ